MGQLLGAVDVTLLELSISHPVEQACDGQTDWKEASRSVRLMMLVVAHFVRAFR
jgi:hypothetical protein